MKYDIEFLNGLLVKLREYCTKTYGDSSDEQLLNWVDQQELTTQGGYRALEEYCTSVDRKDLMKIFEDCMWYEFDDYMCELSEQLVERMNYEVL